ncbi:hypothetical protein LINPERHAP1_LOCUS30562 [Linum perenne]
MDSRSWQI